MDPKFVNRFMRSFEVEQELYLYLHITSPAMITCFVMLGIVLVANLISCLAFGLLYANMAVFAMAIIALLILLYRYYTAIQLGRKRLSENTNNKKSEITVTAALADEELISEASDREEPIIVPYKQFKKVFVTKHYYFIQTAEKMVYAFKKGAFTVGKEEDFIPYVQQIIDHNKKSKH